MAKDDVPAALRDMLPPVRSVGVITGAGISAESGIPTYRGSGGLYDDPAEGARTVEALSMETLRDDPDRTWHVLRALAKNAAQAEPNAAHYALVALESAVQRFTLLTQNVDNLHARAGQQHAIEIHGNTFDLRCTQCIWKKCHWKTRVDLDTLLSMERLPMCPACEARTRPDVVLFGEMLDSNKLAQLQRSFFEDPLDLLLVIGTSALFPYIVEPVLHARRTDTLVVEINPERTDLSGYVDFHWAARAGVAVPAFVRALSKPERT